MGMIGYAVFSPNPVEINLAGVGFYIPKQASTSEQHGINDGTKHRPVNNSARFADLMPISSDRKTGEIIVFRYIRLPIADHTTNSSNCINDLRFPNGSKTTAVIDRRGVPSWTDQGRERGASEGTEGRLSVALSLQEEKLFTSSGGRLSMYVSPSEHLGDLLGVSYPTHHGRKSFNF